MSYLRQVHPYPSQLHGVHPRDGLRGLNGWGDTLKYWAGQSMANSLANSQVDEAEARGAPATTVAAWRSLLVDYNNAKDLDSIQALGMEASGWTAAGNQGVITTRVSDSVEQAKAKVAAVVEKASATLDKASDTANKALYFGVGLAIFYVYVSARR